MLSKKINIKIYYFMKKSILIISLLLGALSISADVQYPYFKASQDTFQTFRCINEKGDLIEYKGPGFRAGQEQWITTIIVYKADLPAKLDFDTINYPLNRIIRFTDKDGKVEFEQVLPQAEALVSFAKSVKYSAQPSAVRDVVTATTLERGGEYTVNLELQNTTLKHTFDTTFYDYPSFRTFNKAKDTNVGTPVQIQGRYNTGYPYAPASYADGLYGQFTLIDTAFKEIKKVRKDLTFKTNPLNKKAVIDTLEIEQAGLEPGSYRLIYETNWKWREDAKLKDTLLITVNDTMRVEATINKTTFSKDEQLELNFSLDYGYPYIRIPDSITNKPYVRINATLVDTIKNDYGEVLNLQALLMDTVKVMDDSLYSKKLNYAGKLQFDLSKVPAENYGRKLALNMEVFFNSVTQNKRSFTLQIDKPTAVEEIKNNPSPTHKFIKDGRLYILHQGTLYDMQGNKQ